MFGHKNFDGDRRVIGRSIIVGRIIFNIVGDLGFGDNLNHGFGRRRLGWRDQFLLRKQRRLVLG